MCTVSLCLVTRENSMKKYKINCSQVIVASLILFNPLLTSGVSVTCFDHVLILTVPNLVKLWIHAMFDSKLRFFIKLRIGIQYCIDKVYLIVSVLWSYSSHIPGNSIVAPTGRMLGLWMRLMSDLPALHLGDSMCSVRPQKLT